jgi:DNA recombination protein RmuC
MDTNLIVFFLIVLTLIIAGGLYLIYRKLGNGDDKSSAAGMQLLQSQLNQLTAIQNEKLDRTIRELNERLRDQTSIINDQLGKSHTNLQQQFALSQKVVREVTEQLTKLDDTNKQVIGFAEQMQSLENILKNPKQRGVLGEYYLETVLKNVLPPDAYKLQSKFKNGEIVDALVITRDGNIPVDAKFSLENYNRLSTAETKDMREKLEKLFKQDLMNRIDETAKYIRPEEGTLDFAFMFIPADGLYYDLLVQRVGSMDINREGLIEYAFKKRVMIVSPTTFFAYLQTVLQGLRSLKIEESTKIIQDQVGKLQKHLRAYEKFHSDIGNRLGSTVKAYNDASNEFRKIDKDMMKISGGEAIEILTEEVERPTLGLGTED